MIGKLISAPSLAIVSMVCGVPGPTGTHSKLFFDNWLSTPLNQLDQRALRLTRNTARG